MVDIKKYAVQIMTLEAIVHAPSYHAHLNSGMRNRKETAAAAMLRVQGSMSLLPHFDAQVLHSVLAPLAGRPSSERILDAC